MTRRRPAALAVLIAAAAATLLVPVRTARAAEFVVTSPDDAGPGTLRAAIAAANALPGPDAISFALAAEDRTLSPLTPLPTITDTLRIDGGSLPGAPGLPGVEIEGSQGFTAFDGLRVAAPGSVLRNLTLDRWGAAAVRVSAAGAVIEDCQIGTDLAGAAALGNAVGVDAADAPGLILRRSVISGSAVGVRIAGASTGTRIIDCRFGTDRLGLSPLGNGTAVFFDAATGGARLETSLLADNGPTAAVLVGAGSADVSVRGCVLGLDARWGDLPNYGEGVRVEDAARTRIDACVIVGSLGAGVFLRGPETRGTHLTGSVLLGNLAGVAVADGARESRLGGLVGDDGIDPGNDIGGSLTDGLVIFAGAGPDNRATGNAVYGNFAHGAAVFASGVRLEDDRFSDNGGDGVLVGREHDDAPWAERVTITRSSFRRNGDLGIRLDGFRSVFAAAGGNRKQPAPRLAQALVGGGQTRAVGTLTAEPNKSYVLEFFASSDPDPSGTGEGEVFLGTATVVTGAGGQAAVNAGGLGALAVGQYLTATATDPDGNTSEFSNAVAGETNPAPALESISPERTLAGSPAFTLTVTGRDFTRESRVLWEGQDRPTTFVSATELRAAIAAADVATAGVASVAVNTPAPGGGTSAPLAFTVENPVPSLTAVSPDSAPVGGASRTVTLTGARFVPGSRVLWEGQERPMTFVSATELRATLPASDFAAAGVYALSVRNPAPGGGTSGTVAFSVVNPLPAVAALGPTSVFAGASSLDLLVTGSDFVRDSVALWGGQPRPTAYVSATTLRVSVPAADLAVAGSVLVSVRSPAPGGGTSNALRFMISGVPQLALASATASAGGATVTVRLVNFGTAPAVAPQITLVRLGGRDTAAPLPLTLPDLPAGATSAPVILSFGGAALPPGRSVLQLTVRSAGRVLSAARLVTIP